ncbi:MerR family DNA-binding transcriptional regulator [Bifidobacterium sp. SMA15]|uniref:MerR family DNA-binding transcriptional regulator n=1 Tax=Bifidobacterium platyrrhinorum TaxID=2661628 RepID=A0A6L9SPV9_9BIFI|nr:MerR family DNA-binding transcriptional regulator [Bifidobacterium platyrrhinorum]
MSPNTTWHTIREASLASGLPESALRYYEQIGIIPPIARDPSGRRVYSDDDAQALLDEHRDVIAQVKRLQAQAGR